MAHFAHIDSSGTVTHVVVADADFIASGALGDPQFWVQTSYNTRGGVHYGADGAPDGGTPLRKNYAGAGFTYDVARDAFIPPRTYPSWTLDEGSCLWVPPIPYPEDGRMYQWNEPSRTWVVVAPDL